MAANGTFLRGWSDFRKLFNEFFVLFTFPCRENIKLAEHNNYYIRFQNESIYTRLLCDSCIVNYIGRGLPIHGTAKLQICFSPAFS